MADFANPLSGKTKMPFPWTENLNLDFLNRLPASYHVGRRVRPRSKSKPIRPDGTDITSLQRSFSLWDGVRDFQKHDWKFSDIQYFVLGSLVLFSLYIAPPAPSEKTLAVLGGLWLLLMPATRQFFLPSLSIWTWLLYFFCSR